MGFLPHRLAWHSDLQLKSDVCWGESSATDKGNSSGSLEFSEAPSILNNLNPWKDF